MSFLPLIIIIGSSVLEFFEHHHWPCHHYKWLNTVVNKVCYLKQTFVNNCKIFNTRIRSIIGNFYVISNLITQNWDTSFTASHRVRTHMNNVKEVLDKYQWTMLRYSQHITRLCWFASLLLDEFQHCSCAVVHPFSSLHKRLRKLILIIQPVVFHSLRPPQYSWLQRYYYQKLHILLL